MQNFISWNTELLEKHASPTEIILVNWNPITENESLEKLIQWPEKRKFVAYKIITVPEEIHKNFANPTIRKPLPLFEYLAKNAGIRRSKGEFILAMNPDVLIPKEIISFLAGRQLKSENYYRANRLDFIKSIDTPSKLWLKAFTYKIKKTPSTLSLFYFQILTNIKILLYASIRMLNFLWKEPLHFKAENKYHCNVSGDFMLMHRDAWQALKGNPENTYLALHTDALTVVMAASHGLHEKVFSKPIYHQEHSRRFDANEKGNEENRSAYLYFQEEAQEMIKNKKPRIYNDDNWGLRNFELSEINF